MTTPFPKPCRLTDGSVIVRLPERRDAESIATYYGSNRKHLTDSSPVLPAEIQTPDFWRLRIETLQQEFADDRSCHTFIFPTDDSTVIGVAGLSEFVRGPFQAAYLGYSLAREHQGRGLMHAALSLLIPFAFKQLNLHRIMANYMPRNTRSGAVLERLGFVQEGVAKHYLLINGAWEDHLLTSLTNHQWQFHHGAHGALNWSSTAFHDHGA